MPEPEGSPEPAQNKQEESEVNLREVAAKALALLGTGAAVATLAYTASRPNRPSGPEAGKSVPHVTFLKDATDPGVDKVITGRIDNPIEGGQKLLDIAANTDPQKVNMNYIYNGEIMAINAGDKPFELYHAPFGVEKFMPAKPDPNNDGRKDPLKVPAHHWLVWINRRSIAISPNIETVYAGKVENNKAEYFLTVDQAYKDKAQYFSRKGEQGPPLEAVVNDQGDLEVNGVTVKASEIRVLTDEQWKAMLEEQNLKIIANPQTSGH